MNKAETAKELFLSGANCAQAVAAAFADDCKISREEMLRLASGFGGGMGRMREVCGAFSALVLIAGLKHGSGDLTDKAAKDAQYALVQKLAQRYKAETGSIVCRELLGLERGADAAPQSTPRTEAFYRKRPCAELVALAAQIAEEEL